MFVYERFKHGLGFTEKAFDRLDEIMPRVLETVENCPCVDGCPCCVGKPLRQSSVWNVERGEGSIPSKAATIMVLKGMLGDQDNLQHPDRYQLNESAEERTLRLEQALRRRLERGREPERFHPITAEPNVKTEYPEVEKEADLDKADVTQRTDRRNKINRALHRRISKEMPLGRLPPVSSKEKPDGIRRRGGNATPRDFPGRRSLNCRPEPSRKQW